MIKNELNLCYFYTYFKKRPKNDLVFFRFVLYTPQGLKPYQSGRRSFQVNSFRVWRTVDTHRRKLGCVTHIGENWGEWHTFGEIWVVWHTLEKTGFCDTHSVKTGLCDIRTDGRTDGRTNERTNGETLNIKCSTIVEHNNKWKHFKFDRFFHV